MITTSQPVVSEQIFRELIAPFEKNGQILRRSNYRVDSVLMADDRVLGVEFMGATGETLTVRATLTIDASDWGDVIKGSGAKWEAGQDPKSRYNEPSASVSGEPATDLNPITWCMILEQQEKPSLFPKPEGYDPAWFNGQWGWIKEEFAYTTRRLVDGQGYKEIDHPDILLINNPSIDYPLDTYPKSEADALEATEPGTSKKNLVALTPEQREIVFADARNHTLKYYYHLQQNFPKFHHMALSREFGTKDHLPPKPYVRESLRLVAKHILKEQEVVGFEARSNYATVMFPDAVFCWQFELDFHPTRRKWTTNKGDTGPWEADFRGNRRFGRGGTGRAVFPLRALLPESTKGLIGAQKNLAGLYQHRQLIMQAARSIHPCGSGSRSRRGGCSQKRGGAWRVRSLARDLVGVTRFRTRSAHGRLAFQGCRSIRSGFCRVSAIGPQAGFGFELLRYRVSTGSTGRQGVAGPGCFNG